MTRLKSVTGAPLFVLVFIGGCLVVEEGVTDVTGPPSIVLQPASTRMVFFGQTKQFGATVRNALGEFVPSEVAWSSSDESVFTVIGGNVTAVGDGTAELRATVEQTTAVAAVTVEQTPASIPIVSGKGQRAVAGTPLDEPIVVHVVDEGGARMSGVTVSFTPAEGGSVSSDVVETDANGEASTVWTLGQDKFGAQSLGVAADRAENRIRAFAVPATPIPDLGIEGGIRFATGEPTDLESFEITVDVVNLGNAATPGAFPLTLSVDGTSVETFEIEQLEAEERVELTYTLGPLVAGRHEVSIVLDPDDEIDEWFDDNNRASAQLSVAQQRVIEPGDSVTLSSTTVDEVLHFRIDVAEGQQEALNVRLSGGTGDADLFVNFGNRPGVQYDYECQSGESTNFESCQMVPVRAGSYHVAVHAFSAFGPTTLTVAVGGRWVEPFDIDVRFVGAVSTSRENVIREAVKQWESVIARGARDYEFGNSAFPPRACVPGSPPVSGSIDDLLVFVTFDSIDGEGGTVASGQPCLVREVQFSRAASATIHEAVIGGIILDEQDLAGLEADGMLQAVVSHNTAHVLGFGFQGNRLWGAKDLLADPVQSDEPGADAHFTGPLAIAAFDAAGGLGYPGAGIPVENAGGPGLANEHWREAVFGEELMSTVLTSGSPPLSLITIESLADMGYGVDLTRADAYTLPTGGIAALTAPDGPVVHLHEHLGRYPVWLAPIGAVDRRKPVLKNDDPRRR